MNRNGHGNDGLSTGAPAGSPSLVERLQQRVAELEHRSELLENEAEALHAELEACAREITRLETEVEEVRGDRERNSGTNRQPEPRGERSPHTAGAGDAVPAPWWARFARRVLGGRS